MTGVVKAELLKLSKRGGIRAIVLIWPALGLIFGYVIPFFIRNVEEIAAEAGGVITDSLLPEQFVANALGGFPLFGFALTLILGGLAVGSEFGWKTMGPALIQGPRRYIVHLGRVVALVLLAGLMTLLALFVGAITSAIMTVLLDRSSAWPSGWEMLQGFAGGWLIFTIGVVLGATLALILRSTALAVGLGLVYVLVLESLFAGFAGAADWVAAIAEYLPGVSANALAASFQTSAALDAGAGGPGGQALVSATRGTATLGAYLLALLVLGLVLFVNRDVAD